jgi:hypothetical protein
MSPPRHVFEPRPEGPSSAALAGAGVATAVRGGLGAPLAGAALLAAGVAVELIVIHDYPGQLHWLEIALPAVCGVAAVSLFIAESRRAHAGAIAAGVAALLIAPAIWAFDTLGYPTQSTFPAGGPASLASDFGGFGGFGGRRRAFFAAPPSGAPGAPAGSAPLFGPTGGGSGAGGGSFAGGSPRFGGGFGGLGGSGIPSSVISYVDSHGGGTIAVSSQTTAASEILDPHANVAGIGGFTGAETDPSVAWLAQEVAAGRIRWVYTTGTTFGFGGRPGASAALAAAEQACTPVAAASSSLYDCAGKAAALRALS